MFIPVKMYRQIFQLCKEREARGDIVFTLVRQENIRAIPEGTVMIVPSYTLCPGRPVPDVQAVSTEPLIIATDNTEEYIVLTTHGTFELQQYGIEDFNDCNYACAQELHDAGDFDEIYALTLPWLTVELFDGDVKAVDPIGQPKQKVGRKLEFL